MYVLLLKITQHRHKGGFKTRIERATFASHWCCVTSMPTGLPQIPSQGRCRFKSKSSVDLSILIGDIVLIPTVLYRSYVDP